MRLLRYGKPGNERPALIAADGSVRDLSDVLIDISADTISDLASLRAIDPNSLPMAEVDRIGPCVSHVGKFICIGLNYIDHAKETNSEIPAEPIVFMKSTTAIVGPYDDVVIPRGSTKTDWEVELGVVIGALARDVPEASADAHIAGYCVVNDVSERAWQLERGGQWVKGKSADTFGPLGPWLVTPDEIPDPQALAVWLEIDGVRVQNGNTRTMIFGVRHLISYVSRFMTLLPGDVISTGTPPGVGLGMRPPRFLQPGQSMRLGIEGLGEQQQRVVAQTSNQ